MARLREPFRSTSAPIRTPVPVLVSSIVTAVFLILSSCTLLAHSPRLLGRTLVPILADDDALITSPSGHVPYQKWRLPSWKDGMRYVWVVGHHDFRKSDQVELILYFHGMHSGDYYRLFRNELEELAASRPAKPFLFVGFVDTPYTVSELRSKNRWRSLVPQAGERPDPLFGAVNSLFKAFRKSFPRLKKSRTDLVMAGFSGGGRVLNSVGNWLAQSPKDDPYAKVFLSKLRKIVYFDCWFDPAVVETVPALLESNPAMKIIGTVHMAKPKKHAALLAGRFKMRKWKKKDELIGAGGRLLIFTDTSHWKAMISRLRQALET
jgi:hypothetical protein